MIHKSQFRRLTCERGVGGRSRTSSRPYGVVRKINALGVGALSLSCATNPAQQPDEPAGVPQDADRSGDICDGDDGIALAAYQQPQFERQGGAAVAVELGAGFLYVDGHCNYWVWKTNEHGAFRTGSLGTADQRRLHEDFAFDAWESLSGRWEGAGFDTPYHVFYSRTAGFACAGSCPTAPAVAQGAYQAGIDWRATLWDRGQPMIDAPMRVAPFTEDASDFTSQYGQAATPWPFDVSPNELTLWKRAPTEPGTGYLLTDEATLEAVRLERDRAASRGPDTGLWFGPYEGRYYGMSARETLPFENDVGLINEPNFVGALWE